MSEQPSKIGYLLINLGTPDSPEVKDVRRYLGEFLMDPHVLDVPWAIKALIVNAFILPFRPKDSAEAYSKIWTPEGSPLLVKSQALADKLQERLDAPVAIEYALWQTLHCRRPVDPARKRRDSGLHRTPVPSLCRLHDQNLSRFCDVTPAKRHAGQCD